MRGETIGTGLFLGGLPLSLTFICISIRREDLSLWSSDDVSEASIAWSQERLTSLLSGKDNTASDAAADSSISANNARNRYEFVRQGARGLQAFCRPYPIATVGIPERLTFSIETTVFELDVRVSPSSSGDAVDPSQPTKIYVPIVHYAARQKPVFAGRSAPGSGIDVGQAIISASQTQLPLKAPFLYDFTRAGKDTFYCLGNLAVDVEVSEGRWELGAGQLLKWYYDRPLEDEKLVQIKIKRIGGPIVII